MSRAARIEARELLTLALPIVVGHLGNQVMGFVDTAMVGRLGAAAMGGVGIGSGIFFTLTLVAMGCALGMEPLVAQAMGAGERLQARRIYWQGARVAVAVSLPIMGLILAAPAILSPIGVAPEVVVATREYLWGRVWNAVPVALFGAARCYLQAVGATRAIVVSTVVANIANFILNGIFIFGDGALVWCGLPGIGLPAMGAFGAGLASSISAAFSAWILFAAIDRVESPPDPERRRRRPELEARILRIGIPIGLQMLVEVSAFAAASVMSGKIGVVAAAANQVALTLASMAFMVPLGISTATAVRVGRAVGGGDSVGARRAGLVGLGAGMTFMAFSAAAFVLIPGPLARVLTDRPEVIAEAVVLVQVAAVFQLFDGLQVVGAGALRGIGETRSTLIANVIGHFVIGLPLAIGLTFHAGLGAKGLWWGLSAGLTTVGVALSARFFMIARGELKRS